MSVPPFVPPDVPAAGGTPASRASARKTSKRNVGTASYLTRTGDGWRFQMRLPGRFALAGASSTIRGALGPRSRPEARRLGQQLAALCTAICDAALIGQPEADMTTNPLDEKEIALAQQVVSACQQAIKTAVNQPSRAIGLAKGLGAALTSLRLVESEFGRGAAGNRAVIDHADAISRAALQDVLKLAPDPDAAQKALSTISDIPRSLTTETAPPQTRAAEGKSLPTFGEISQAYIDMRIGRDGADHPDISILQLRRQTLLDVLGDRPIDEYWPRDLQRYVNTMKSFPANVTKRSEMQGKTTLEIVEANKNLALKPMAEKTMRDGYVANIRTMARHLMSDLSYRDPFAGAKLTYPGILRPSTPREGIGVDVINRIFRNGVDSGQLDETMAPPLAKLSARRIGPITYLRGSDIREKHGVMVAQVGGIVFVDGCWQRVPIKTSESAGFFVLHNFFREIGFIDWARRQEDGWIFAAAHEHRDPAKYMSKVMSRLLGRSGAQAGEVFHSLRGDGIDAMRKANMQDRTKRLQAGHELGDEHEKYGHRALSAEECQRLAHMPLPAGIDWDIFRNLDFDALAAKRRGRGRPIKKGR